MSIYASTTVNRVVLSGSEDNRARLREVLPRALQEKIAGEIGLDMTATSSDIWEHAFDVAQAAQRQAETELLEQVTTVAHKGGAGAIGLADTLAALRAGRVYQLLVDKGLHAPGQQCSNCGAVVIEKLDHCPYCQNKLNATVDAVNLAVHRALEAGVKVSVLEPSALLTKAGGIAAVLRY